MSSKIDLTAVQAVCGAMVYDINHGMRSKQIPFKIIILLLQCNNSHKSDKIVVQFALRKIDKNTHNVVVSKPLKLETVLDLYIMHPNLFKLFHDFVESCTDYLAFRHSWTVQRFSWLTLLKERYGYPSQFTAYVEQFKNSKSQVTDKVLWYRLLKSSDENQNIKTVKECINSKANIYWSVFKIAELKNEVYEISN